jgi:hypothetical protein
MRTARTGIVKLAVAIALSLGIVGCRSFPWPNRDAERCTMFINPVIVDGRELWEGKCRCHDYRISLVFLGRSSEPTDHPVEYCKRLVGFRPTEWTDYFVSWFEEMQIWDNQNKEFEDDLSNDPGHSQDP